MNVNPMRLSARVRTFFIASNLLLMEGENAVSVEREIEAERLAGFQIPRRIEHPAAERFDDVCERHVCLAVEQEHATGDLARFANVKDSVLQDDRTLRFLLHRR